MSVVRGLRHVVKVVVLGSLGGVAIFLFCGAVLAVLGYA